MSEQQITKEPISARDTIRQTRIQKLAELADKGINVTDLGTNSSESVDYPIYADKVTESILDKTADLGILVCGTGIGISIRANRKKGIRAAVLYSDEVAVLTKKHNNANVIVLVDVR